MVVSPDILKEKVGSEIDEFSRQFIIDIARPAQTHEHSSTNGHNHQSICDKEVKAILDIVIVNAVVMVKNKEKKLDWETGIDQGKDLAEVVL